MIPIESIEHAAGVLLGLGSDVEAIEPATLRRRIADVAAELVARYA